ncbi:NgoPII restriction endonuclease [Beggiatoa alba B18LD]|uniref:NgoPII restriction endonuclease n=1 Tax=Beggiatoa alba B18LD TaxID=395493 RepID=I3CCM7_9GAMM|nr:NgoPII family restriction endonuclease [Beggiatoa alba]EIJ41370.1 NgoPII restriction endonuclease [Beggiatoa alba B18LD]
MTNLIIALKNLIQNPITDLNSFYQGSNRANSMGDALETYIKDIFCNSLHLSDTEKDKLYSQNFSYIGNQNNPPDIIIKGGDAIEVKKIESISSAIALNSSYPKSKLFRNDSRITNACKECEGAVSWEQKDIIYIIGVAPKSTLKALWFVYGDCYAAESEIYHRVANKISQGISEISGVELVATNELAKVKKVDPLGITDLRVRGMWHIENPIKVFQHIASITELHQLTVHTILLEEKYNTFPQSDREQLEQLQSEHFTIRNVAIRSPSNLARLLNVKLLSYTK